MPARAAATPIPTPTAAPVERPPVPWLLLVWFDAVLAVEIDVPSEMTAVGAPASAVVKSDG